MTRPPAVRATALLLVAIAAAQAQALAERPRVALVLSGGGALGIAHVGVLEVLEEMHVPVDIVAGTSMGAIVGGLYAAGYSPQELRDIVATLDWREVLQDRPDRRRLPYRRKVDDLNYLTKYEVGFSDGKLRMPSGFISGHRLGVALRTLSLRVTGITDFDQLPLPFRAVATDLRTGEMVVLGGGDLATSLRASMAVPGVFSPVEVNGRLLADGGMVRNLPTDVARAMGADLVIAVDLGEPLAARARPDSITSVVEQTSGMLTRLNVERALADADLVLRPAVSGYGLLEFSRWPEILPRGRDAARAAVRDLAAIALPDAEWNAHLACRRRATPALPLVEVRVDPGPGQPPELVSRLVHTRPGRVLDVGELCADIERLYEVGEFETVDFSLEQKDDAWALAIAARPKSWGPNFLRFGLALAADLEGSSEFNLLTAFTMTRLNRLGAEFKTSVQIGGSPLLAGEFYQPLETSRTLFAAVGAQASQVKQQVQLGPESVQYRIGQLRTSAALGLQLGRFGEIRFGLRRDSLHATPTSEHGGEAAATSRTDAGLVAGLAIDQMDNLNFPRHGVLAFAEIYDGRTSLGTDEPYRLFSLQSYAAATHGRHTLLGHVSVSSGLGTAVPPGHGTQLGGLFNLSGLPKGEVGGGYGGVAGVIYLLRVGRLPNFGQGIYAGLSVEAGNAWNRSADVNLSALRHSFALVVGADTAIGPVYLGQGFTTGGKDSYYLLVGRTF